MADNFKFLSAENNRGIESDCMAPFGNFHDAGRAMVC
jgi:hypothetical protein